MTSERDSGLYSFKPTRKSEAEHAPATVQESLVSDIYGDTGGQVSAPSFGSETQPQRSTDADSFLHQLDIQPAPQPPAQWSSAPSTSPFVAPPAFGSPNTLASAAPVSSPPYAPPPSSASWPGYPAPSTLPTAPSPAPARMTPSPLAPITFGAPSTVSSVAPLNAFNPPSSSPLEPVPGAPTTLESPTRIVPPPAPLQEAGDSAFDLDVDDTVPVSRSAYSNVKVLLVDPTNGLETSLARAIEDFGFSMDCVESGAIARDEMLKTRYDVVLIISGDDANWVRMFLQTVAPRHASARFVVAVPGGQLSLVPLFLSLGASDVWLPPYPEGTTVLVRLHCAAPERVPLDGVDGREVLRVMQQVNFHFNETVCHNFSGNAEATERASAAERELENVRGELNRRLRQLTMLGEHTAETGRRAASLDEMCRDQQATIEAKSRECEQLRAQIVGLEDLAMHYQDQVLTLSEAPPPAAPAPQAPVVAIAPVPPELHSAAAALAAHEPALDLAMLFLTRLSQEGTPIALEAQAHLKGLRHMLATLRRVEELVAK